MRVKYNKKNTYGDDPCCSQLGKDNKTISSVIFCFLCNTFCLRKHFKINSFCKKYNWDKTCETCLSSVNRKQ